MSAADKHEAQAAVLRGLDQAAERIEAAEHARDEQIHAARDLGITVREIATAARLGEATIYRIIGRQARLPARTGQADALNAGLLLIAELGGPMDTAQQGISAKDLKAKARRFQLAAKQIVRSPAPASAEWHTFTDATAVAEHLLGQ